MKNGWQYAGLRYGLFGYFVRLWNIILCCEMLIWFYAILWCILFSYLDFHNAKQSGILHSVDRKLKDASKKSVRNFSFVRIEYLRTNRGMIQNMRFLGDWLRGRLVEAIGRFAMGRADGAIGRFAIGRPAGYGL
jgi:hypothetical protein